MATRYNLFLILVFSLYSVTCGVTDFFEHDIIRDVIRMKRQTDLFSKFEPAKNSIGGHIVKRETQDQCQAQKSKYLSKLNSDPPKNFNSSFSLQGDTHGYLSLAWCGVDDIVAVTTESFIYDAQSVVYISTDSGKSFINISTQVKNAHIRGDVGLQQHPFDDKRVYLIAYNQKNTSRSVLYSSVNSGKSFTQIGLDFVLSSPIHFHPNSKYTDFMMVVSDSKLYISKNNGKSWEKIREKVQSVKWGSVDDDTPPTIYCVVQVSDDQFSFAKIFGNDIRDNDLEQSLNWGKDWNKLRKHVFGFGVKGKFLYVSTFLTQEAEESGKRRLEVSKDRGATWYEVQLPAIEPERFYSILDMTDDRVFIHVDEPGTQGYGTLYTSDSTGIIYTESLKRHVFNILSGYTDFYPVKSMRGVYITSQMEENNEIHTMISYDRGGEWNTIQQPGGTICTDLSKKVCNLQIHGIYSLLRRNYKSNLPLSVDSAKGLLLAHGHVGATLDKTTPDVYLSTNGGYNWNKVLDGPHHYQIADQGGLLVAVPLEDYPKVVKFSTDEGGCWHEYTFTNDDIQFAGLLTAPGNSEMVLALWGYDKTTRFWKVTVVDFSKLVTETCKDPDYVTWTPHITNERTGCFLGMKEKFRKIKKDSWCHNMKGLNLTSTINTEYCPCLPEDYECDYGYYRKVGSVKCTVDPVFKGPPLDICERGHKEHIIPRGLHKIPGDKCKGNVSSPFGDTQYELIDLDKTCEGGRSLVYAKVKNQYLPLTKNSKICSNTAALASILGVTLLLLIIIVLFFVQRNIFKKGTRRYNYSRLSRSDNGSRLENCRLVIGDEEEEGEQNEMPPNGVSTQHSQSNNSQESGRNQKVTPDDAESARNDDPPLPLHDNQLRQYHDGSDDDMLE